MIPLEDIPQSSTKDLVDVVLPCCRRKVVIIVGVIAVIIVVAVAAFMIGKYVPDYLCK